MFVPLLYSILPVNQLQVRWAALRREASIIRVTVDLAVVEEEGKSITERNERGKDGAGILGSRQIIPLGSSTCQ